LVTGYPSLLDDLRALAVLVWCQLTAYRECLGQKAVKCSLCLSLCLSYECIAFTGKAVVCIVDACHQLHNSEVAHLISWT